MALISTSTDRAFQMLWTTEVTDPARWLLRRAALFWAHVDVRSAADCWRYQGASRLRSGHIKIHFASRNMLVGRAAYWLATGECPPPRSVVHHIGPPGPDAPVCCNPAHLALHVPTREPLTIDVVADLIRQHEQGATWGELAARIGWGTSSLGTALRRAGYVPPRARHRVPELSQPQLDELARRRAEGATWAQLAELANMHLVTVRRPVLGLQHAPTKGVAA